MTYTSIPAFLNARQSLAEEGAALGERIADIDEALRRNGVAPITRKPAKRGRKPGSKKG